MAVAISNAAFAEFVPSHDVQNESMYGNASLYGSYSSHVASAMGDSTYPYSTSHGEGWKTVTTTVSGTFWWWYNIDVRGFCSLTFGAPSSTVYGAGGGSASVSGAPGSNSVSGQAAESRTQASGYYEETDDPDRVYPYGYSYVSANGNVHVQHTAYAAGTVTLPSGGKGYGAGYAYSDCDLYD